MNREEFKTNERWVAKFDGESIKEFESTPFTTAKAQAESFKTNAARKGFDIQISSKQVND